MRREVAAHHRAGAPPFRPLSPASSSCGRPGSGCPQDPCVHIPTNDDDRPGGHNAQDGRKTLSSSAVLPARRRWGRKRALISRNPLVRSSAQGFPPRADMADCRTYHVLMNIPPPPFAGELYPERGIRYRPIRGMSSLDHS